MAGSFSDYVENKVLDHVVGKASFTMPSVWIALCTGPISDATSGLALQEVANANGYARKSTSGADWNAAAAGATSNANAITFAAASGGSWGTVTHFALVDSATWGEGHVLAHGDLTASKTIDDGDTAEFGAGELDITLD